MLRTTLLKYISKEIWAIFGTCLLVFLFIIMATQMLNMMKLIINYGAGFGDFLNLILCNIPGYILIAMPAACLMAVLLSFIRMASDNEIIALHSSGVSLYQLMPPVVIFSLICLLFAGFLTLFWTPYGNRSYEAILKNLLRNRFESQIKEGFNLQIEDLVLYVSSYSPKTKIMKDVFIVEIDGKEERTVIAKQAKLIYEDDKAYLRLTDYKFLDAKEGGSHFLGSSPFSTPIPIPMDEILQPSDDDKIDPDRMYAKELLELINGPEESMKNKNIAKLKLYEMFSLPVAVFFIAIAGAPLGAQIRAHGRTKGIIISLLLFLFYNVILISTRTISENGTINPAIGVWLPVLFLAAISSFLLIISKSNFSFKINRLLNPFTTPRGI